jgi:hypothetical protein
MSRSKPPEDGKHLVEDGEWVGSIAAAYGYFDWDKDVWQHSQNAKLRDLRPDPRVLAVGDELFIPPWEEKKESCATQKKHKFKVKTPTEFLRIRVLGLDGKPLGNLDYVLALDCAPGGGSYQQKNKKTNGDGILEESIPSTAMRGLILFPKLQHTMELRLGYLTPMDFNDKPKLIRGVQQRLLAIGFHPGEIDGLDGPATRSAVMGFQQFCAENKDKGNPRITDAGPVDGVVGAKTRAALLKYYGC